MHPSEGPRFLAQGHWRTHVHTYGLSAVGKIRPWLVDTASLTAKLRAHCVEFKLQCLHQRLSSCLKDEAAMLGVAPPSKVWEREVLLQCDGKNMIFAHTVVPLRATAADWPLFKTLGERSLGTTLFNDPQIKRGRLQFARLPAQHPLMLRLRRALYPNKLDTANLYARRCLYQRKQGLMLVTEVFLPAVTELVQINIK